MLRKSLQRIENTILELLAKVDAEKQKDPAFREVSELFNHPENKLSRTALSKVLPHIKDIINEQAGEQSAFKKKFFNIGLWPKRKEKLMASIFTPSLQIELTIKVFLILQKL